MLWPPPYSGITKVGVTRLGAATDLSPIFPQKELTTFLVIALSKVTLFSYRLLTTPTFRRRLSRYIGVLSKFSHNTIQTIQYKTCNAPYVSGNLFVGEKELFLCHSLDGVTQSGPPPRLPIVTQLPPYLWNG